MRTPGWSALQALGTEGTLTTNPRHLRAKKGEELIFGGSETKRSLGMAEVLLHIDNTSRRLPIDLTKVTRDLRQSAATDANKGGLRIRYSIAVYGAAPQIQFFTKQDNIANGPVPYGAPSHREFIEHNTPIEYRAPGADLGALLFWLAEKTAKK